MPPRFFPYVFILFAVFSNLYSCRTSKQLPYFKDLSDTSTLTKIKGFHYEPLRLQTNDEVEISISSTLPEASNFFNPGVVATPPSGNGSAANRQSHGYVNIYTISSKGFITVPVLGDIKASGLSTEELKSSISEKLKEYLKNAVVIVRLTNFQVTIIGEVGKPLLMPVNGQTINVLEAIGAAGDMTVFGVRRNVKVIRKLPDGNIEVGLLDFNKSSVLQSPWFQLKQNDIVYVQPNKSKGILGTKTDLWVPIFTALIYTAAIIATRN
jgi:polysaccharide export outer membrane protein